MNKPIIGVLIRYAENESKTSFEYIFAHTRRAIINMGGEPLLPCPSQNIPYYQVKYDDYVSLTKEEE